MDSFIMESDMDRGPILMKMEINILGIGGMT